MMRYYLYLQTAGNAELTECYTRTKCTRIHTYDTVPGILGYIRNCHQYSRVYLVYTKDVYE